MYKSLRPCKIFEPFSPYLRKFFNTALIDIRTVPSERSPLMKQSGKRPTRDDLEQKHPHLYHLIKVVARSAKKKFNLDWLLASENRGRGSAIFADPPPLNHVCSWRAKRVGGVTPCPGTSEERGSERVGGGDPSDRKMGRSYQHRRRISIYKKGKPQVETQRYD